MPATPKPPLIDIRPDHWAIVRTILQKHVPQYEVWAFGSRAKWSAKEYSDLDLAVIADKRIVINAPLREVERYDHEWVQAYFHGPRGRAARQAAAATPARLP